MKIPPKNQYRGSYIRSIDSAVMIQVAPHQYVEVSHVPLWEDAQLERRTTRGSKIADIRDLKGFLKRQRAYDKKLPRHLAYSAIERVDLSDDEYDQLIQLRREIGNPSRWAQNWRMVAQQGQRDTGPVRLFLRRYWSSVRQRWVYVADYVTEDDSGLEWHRTTEAAKRRSAAILERRLHDANNLWAERHATLRSGLV